MSWRFWNLPLHQTAKGKSIWHLYIVVMMGLCAGHVQVQATSASDQKTRQDDLYEETLQFCQATTQWDVYVSQLAKDVLSGSGVQAFEATLLDQDSIAAYFIDEGVARVFADLVLAPAFQLAVADCFPDNLAQQQHFVERLFVVDVVGTGVGVVAGSGSWYGIYRILHGLGGQAPRLGAGVGLGVLYYLNFARKRYVGLTVHERAEKDEMLQVVHRQLRSGPIKIAKEELVLFDGVIHDKELELASLGPDDVRRLGLQRTISDLQQQRAAIAARIQGSLD